MKNVYIKQYYPNKDFFWKFLCVTLDNEALGLLERLLTEADWEYKVEDRKQTYA